MSPIDKLDIEQLCQRGIAVIETEAKAVAQLALRIDNQFVTAAQTCLSCEGRVIVTGMGKSGHIGKKIAATLASTGTPAFFVHPAEASHGDLGMITRKDCVLALSYSGKTEELLKILPLIKRLGIPLISMTGAPTSTLAKKSDVHLDLSIDQEACPLGLAPTTSTTAMLVMGDALAVALLEQRGFTVEDFARSHPGGNLGRRLLLLIDDLMHTGDAMPMIRADATLSEALVEMTAKRLGMTTIVESDHRVLGIFTDGDVRRALDQGCNVHETPISTIMTTNFKSIQPGILAAEGLQLMEQHRITSLPVIDDQGILLGMLHLHDLLSADIL